MYDKTLLRFYSLMGYRLYLDNILAYFLLIFRRTIIPPIFFERGKIFDFKILLLGRLNRFRR